MQNGAGGGDQGFIWCMSHREAERQLRFSLVFFSVLIIGCGLIALGQPPMSGTAQLAP